MDERGRRQCTRPGRCSCRASPQHTSFQTSTFRAVIIIKHQKKEKNHLCDDKRLIGRDFRRASRQSMELAKLIAATKASQMNHQPAIGNKNLHLSAVISQQKGKRDRRTSKKPKTRTIIREMQKECNEMTLWQNMREEISPRSDI